MVSAAMSDEWRAEQFDGFWSVVAPRPGNEARLDSVLSGDDAERNARLMAAAPDLLAALETLFDSYKQLADSGDAGNWSLEELDEGKQALAAMAKAKAASGCLACGEKLDPMWHDPA